MPSSEPQRLADPRAGPLRRRCHRPVFLPETCAVQPRGAELAAREELVPGQEAPAATEAPTRHPSCGSPVVAAAAAFAVEAGVREAWTPLQEEAETAGWREHWADGPPQEEQAVRPGAGSADAGVVASCSGEEPGSAGLVGLVLAA